MSRTTSWAAVDQMLVELDAAPPAQSEGSLSGKALLDLERIVGADLDVTPTASERASARWRRTGWLASAAGLVSVTALLVPIFGEDDSAIASWTARPTGIPLKDAAAPVQQCRDWMGDVGPGIGEMAGFGPVLAERRGDWSYVVLTDQRTLVSCVMAENQDSTGEVIGGMGALRPRDVSPMASGQLTGLALDAQSDDDGNFTFDLYGRVGADVESVVVHTHDGQDVFATVSDGYWGAWWPAQGTEAAMLDYSGLSITYTTADGTSRTQPWDALVVPSRDLG